MKLVVSFDIQKSKYYMYTYDQPPEQYVKNRTLISKTNKN